MKVTWKCQGHPLGRVSCDRPDYLCAFDLKVTTLVTSDLLVGVDARFFRTLDEINQAALYDLFDLEDP